MTRTRRTLAIFTLALIVRVCVLGFASQLPVFAHHRLDELVYHEAGLTFAQGDRALGREVLHMSPGYSYFVGVIYTLAGAGPWPVRIVQLLLGLGIVALVMGSARRVAGEPWGSIAGAIAAVYGPLPFYETLLLGTTLSVFSHALLIYLALLAVELRSRRRWLHVGLALGLAVVVRPNALLLVLPLGVAAWRCSRAACLAFLVATAVLVAPVTLRNWIVAGEPVLVTDSGGLNFFLGNGKGAIGTFRIPRDVPEADSAITQFPAFRRFAEEHENRALSAREVDAFWYRVAFARLRKDPWGWLRLMVKKLGLYWNARELPNTEDYAFARLVNPALRWLPGFGLLAPFALLGTLLLFVGNRDQRLLGWINLLTCAGVVIFFVLGHYRMAAVPGLIVAAAWSLRHLYEDARASRLHFAALCAALLAAVALAFLPTQLPDSTADQWFKLGYAHHVEGNLGAAERCYRSALGIDADNLSAEKNLAMLYEGLGRKDEARAVWQALALSAQKAGDAGLQQLAKDHL